MRRTYLLLILTIGLTGCGVKSTTTVTVTKSSESEKPTVAFVSNNPDPFWSIVEAGCRKAESETGVHVIFRKPVSGDPAAQQEVLDSLVQRAVKAIAVSVSDPKNQTAYLNELAAKVPLLAVDNDAPASNRLCYIGTDNYSAGRAAGKLVKQAMPSGGVVALFVGQTESLNAHQRCQGVLDELADATAPADVSKLPALPTGAGQFGKYKLHKIFTDQPEGTTRAVQNSTDALLALKAEPNVCLVGLWAYNPPANLTAVKDAGLLGKVKIVGFDENPVTLQGIEDGHVFATVVQDPFNFGYESVKAMAGLAKGGKYLGGKLRAVPHRVITKSGGEGNITVAEYKAQEAKKAK
ncbi:MAG: sugar-binding protein [Gemmataceae bacterium]|nr:sugar-binding protein [Gemmataceae bacterium]